MNMNRTRDLQIFSLQVYQLSYARKVVGRNLGIREAYIYFLPCLTDKEISEYPAPSEYRFMLSFLLVQMNKQLFNPFHGVWMLVSLLFINHISNILH